MTIPVGDEGRGVESLVVPRVSPLRGGLAEGTLTVTIGASARPAARPQPWEERPTPAAFEAIAPAGSDEAALPDEAAIAVATAAVAATAPVEAGPEQVLHVRFAAAPDERIVAAFRELRDLILARPGATPVVLHIPARPGQVQEMRLGSGIAYDVDLLAEVSRRFGGLLMLRLE